MDISTFIMLTIAVVAMVVYTIAAARDLFVGAPVGRTLKHWLRRVADAFFSVP